MLAEGCGVKVSADLHVVPGNETHGCFILLFKDMPLERDTQQQHEVIYKEERREDGKREEEKSGMGWEVNNRIENKEGKRRIKNYGRSKKRKRTEMNRREEKRREEKRREEKRRAEQRREKFNYFGLTILRTF